MPDRYDNSFSRRPAPLDGNTGRRNEPPAQAEDDPLVELARIVSGNSSFDDIVGGRQPVAAPVVRSTQQPNVRDTSFDLESELMNDLQTSFDPAVRSASGRPLQVEPQPPRAAQPRDEGFDHMRLRPARRRRRRSGRPPSRRARPSRAIRSPSRATRRTPTSSQPSRKKIPMPAPPMPVLRIMAANAHNRGFMPAAMLRASIIRARKTAPMIIRPAMTTNMATIPTPLMRTRATTSATPARSALPSRAARARVW